MIATELLQLDKPAARGLCVEFVLHEYAKSLSIAKKLETISIEEAIGLLEALSNDAARGTFSRSHAIFDKLCFYCETLIQITNIGEDLLDVLDELRTAVLLQRTKLLRMVRQDPLFAPAIPSVSMPSRFVEQLQQFFRLLVPILQASADSETAIFALLEQRKTIQAYLDNRPVDRLLQQIFPEGPQQLRCFLTQGFAARGFGDFCNRHEPLFKDLAWECVQF